MEWSRAAGNRSASITSQVSAEILEMYIPSQPLTRHDIEGRRLIDVLQTEWVDLDGCTVCQCFVRIETGLVFELPFSDPDQPIPLEAVSSKIIESLLKVEWAYGPEGCCGDIVERVVTSELWPSAGLLLRSGRILYCSDYGTPFRVGPLLDRLGNSYDREELMDFWNHTALGER
jgi:hypothetical protein